MPTRIPVVRIWLNRAEGPVKEIGARTVSSLSQADSILQKWAVSAPPERKGYDKVDFKVLWGDGETYEGRFDMDQSHRSKSNMIGTQIQDHLLFLSGLRKPGHLERDIYEAHLEEIGYGEGSDNRATALKMISNYEM